MTAYATQIQIVSHTVDSCIPEVEDWTMHLTDFQKQIIESIRTHETFSVVALLESSPSLYITNPTVAPGYFVEQRNFAELKRRIASYAGLVNLLLDNSLIKVIAGDDRVGYTFVVSWNDKFDLKDDDNSKELTDIFASCRPIITKTGALDVFATSDYKLDSELALEAQVKVGKESLFWTKFIGVASIVASFFSVLISAYVAWQTQDNLSKSKPQEVNIAKYPTDTPPLKVEPLMLDQATLDKIVEALKAKPAPEPTKAAKP